MKFDVLQQRQRLHYHDLCNSAVARAICYGQRGEIRKRYREGQEDQLGALGLVTNAVVLWNTLYMQEALLHLRMMGETPEDEHIARLSPLMHGHINMLGHYTFTLPEDILKGELRPLNFNLNNELSPYRGFLHH